MTAEGAIKHRGESYKKTTGIPRGEKILNYFV